MVLLVKGSLLVNKPFNQMYTMHGTKNSASLVQVTTLILALYTWAHYTDGRTNILALECWYIDLGTIEEYSTMLVHDLLVIRMDINCY